MKTIKTREINVDMPVNLVRAGDARAKYDKATMEANGYPLDHDHGHPLVLSCTDLGRQKTDAGEVYRTQFTVIDMPAQETMAQVLQRHEATYHRLTDHLPGCEPARGHALIFGGAMVGCEPVPATPTPLPLNRKLRQYASVLSYNDQAPIPAVKHLLLEAASKIEALERT